MHPNTNLRIDVSNTDKSNHISENTIIILTILNLLNSMQHENIYVKIVDGVLVITGIVSSLIEKEKVSENISKISGIKQISNLLSVDN